MFVLTVDQIGSRRSTDEVPAITATLRTRLGDRIVLGPDRTAGDEFQVLMADPAATLTAVLDLVRTGTWSVGLGVGRIDGPLPATTREAAGGAFLAARAAVGDAKRAPFRFALVSEAHASLTAPSAADVVACIDLLLALRARRSAAGWELADLLDSGASQAEAAARLGITPQAVSLRARAAGLRQDDAARPALAALLGLLDAPFGAPAGDGPAA